MKSKENEPQRPGQMPDDESSEFTQVCPICGQRYDTRLLHQAIYHERPVHDPIPVEK